MTFILAWKDKRNVFISGDAAVTRKGVSDHYIDDIIKRGRLNTAFGESVYLTNETTVQESVLKIHKINNEFILGYAGTGDIAIDVINELERDNELTKINLVSKLKAATIIYGSDFQMAIGYFNKKSSVLLSFNLYGKRKIRYHSQYEPVRLGNLRSDDLIQLVSSEIAMLFETIARDTTPDKKLVMNCIFMQGVIIRAGLLEQGVGGFFTGGYVNRNGFFWQKDTGMIKFDLRNGVTANSRNPAQLFNNPQFIALLNREGKVCILSFQLNKNYRDVTVFQNYINSFELRNNYDVIMAEFDTWKSTYEIDISDVLENFSFEYLVFFCSDKDAPNKMTFIEKESLTSEKYFKISWVNNIPMLNIPGTTVDEFNPLKGEYFNQFHWLPI